MKYRKLLFPFLPVLLALCLFSCKNKKDELVFDYHRNYYPTDSGHYVIYDVDSIFYSYNGQHHNDTARYQWMEVVEDTLYDNLGQLNYKLVIYRRPDSLATWNIDRIWYLLPTAGNLQIVEDDARFIKLVFPPAEGEEWNGNIYLTNTGPYEVFQDWTYTYSDIHQPYQVNGFSFDSTLTVNEIDDENLIQKRLRKEVYAKGVGLIYQEWESLEKQNVQGNWQEDAEQGFRIRMRIAGHN